MRNDFTTIFGGVGRRRTIKDFFNTKKVIKEVFKIQKIRRAHQGWRNKTFGTLNALKIRLIYGRRKPTAQFRR
jgi:ATP-dependent Zn protease